MSDQSELNVFAKMFGVSSDVLAEARERHAEAQLGATARAFASAMFSGYAKRRDVGPADVDAIADVAVLAADKIGARLSARSAARQPAETSPPAAVTEEGSDRAACPLCAAAEDVLRGLRDRAGALG